MKEGKTSLFRTVLSMMISPREAIRSTIDETRWYLALIVSGAAFALFFLQTGLDMYKTGQRGMIYVIQSAGTGFLYGAIAIPIISAAAWILLKAAKGRKPLIWTVTSFCLSYSGALIYGILGVIASLVLGWKTSLAFGIGGILWAIGPMMFTAREVTGGKIVLSVPIATVFAGLVLLSWSVWGGM